MEIFKHIGANTLLLLLVCCLGASQVRGLTYDYYIETCPKLEYIVRAGMESVSLADPSTPAAMLRLMFHDCQVQGCDASILLDSDGGRTLSSEMDSAKNFGIRKRGVVSLLKSAVEAVCPRQVSCSDILVLAAREAVSLSGGPKIDVPLGRRDSSTPPSFRAADASLPSADVGVDEMLRLFANKGMTVEESVAILGAHTLGSIHCVNLENRLYNSSSGTESANAKTNTLFEDMLKLKCPKGSLASKISIVQNDLTSVVFDNRYFVDTLNGRGLLRIDAGLAFDRRTEAYVRKFAADEEAFFKAFASAFVKLSSSNVLTGSKGVVRRTCNSL